jgi:hypothetical protein
MAVFQMDEAAEKALQSGQEIPATFTTSNGKQATLKFNSKDFPQAYAYFQNPPTLADTAP